MSFVRPVLPSFDPDDWKQLPFRERARAVCLSWAEDGYGTPAAVFVLYALKLAAFVGVWAWTCADVPGLGPLSEVTAWLWEPLALYKAIVWAMLFEVMGFGCGSGPLTGRYLPPVGGFLYFLRPRTTRLPPWPGLPGCSGHSRGLVDVGLYGGLLVALMAELAHTGIGGLGGFAALGLLAVAGLRDRTVFLAARGEHYWVALLVTLISLEAGEEAMVAAWMGLWAALWFFAGVSKLNRHFESVVCVMMSNSPVMPLRSVRRAMYRDFPRDLRPSALARGLGHFGTLLELGVPIVLITASGSGSGFQLVLGLALMWLLHSYITLNVPMGVPLEWNVVMVYGGMALFWGHRDVAVLDAAPLAGGLLLLLSVGVPVLGNLLPEQVSFLPAMRYYAGNWAMSVWLFKGDAHRKLEALTTSAPWVEDQLGTIYDKRTIAGLLSKVMAFRLMHLHGRVVGMVLPQAIDDDLADRRWVDGELVAGLLLGWNFGDGHLHGDALLDVVRQRCGFEPGELRVITVESQPIHRAELRWRIHDAADGVLDTGVVRISTLRARQPWDLGH